MHKKKKKELKKQNKTKDVVQSISKWGTEFRQLPLSILSMSKRNPEMQF